MKHQYDTTFKQTVLKTMLNQDRDDLVIYLYYDQDHGLHYELQDNKGTIIVEFPTVFWLHEPIDIDIVMSEFRRVRHTMLLAKEVIK